MNQAPGRIAIALAAASAAFAQALPSLDAARPIPARDSIWTEELTWMEVRDAVRSGKTTIVIGTGGIEQNGPYVAGGKHKGAIEPKPGGHMRYPGTIGVEEPTFVALLTDICRSYQAHGFRDIVLVGDSGGNQAGMKKVAEQLNRKWRAESARVHFLPEYYSEDPWSYGLLKSRGIVQIDKTPPAGEKPDRPAHTVQDPAHIRAAERVKAGQFSLHGVDLSPLSKTVELGRQLAEYRAQITAKAYRRSLGRLRGAK